MDITVSFDSLQALILVFVRMAGLILFNPLLSRKNVPSQVRVALALGMTFILTPAVDTAGLAALNDIAFVMAMLKELAIGLVCAFVFQIYYYLLFFAGDLMDMQFGMSMAKVFDPGTNIQMSVTGNLFSIVFMLYIFATGSHLLMLKIFASSYQIIPIGVPKLSFDLAGFMMTMFINAFSLLLRLTLPFLAVEFTMEVGMGVLMKLIPQIHVFVINIQFKMLIGLLLIFMYAQPITEFLDRYLAGVFQNMEKVLFAAVGQG